jgi:hypothetical protein
MNAITIWKHKPRKPGQKLRHEVIFSQPIGSMTNESAVAFSIKKCAELGGTRAYVDGVGYTV